VNKTPGYIVVVDMRENNGKVTVIVEDDDPGSAKLFQTFEEAAELMDDHPLGKFPWEIVRIH
jgi:hypothetical protein